MTNEPFRLRRLALPFYVPSFLWAAGAGAILPVLPLYVRELGADLSLTGAVVSMFALGALTGNIPGSFFIARVGKRTTMILAVIVEVVLAIAAAFVSNPYQLIPLLFGLGGVHTLYFVARLAYFRELVPQRSRGRALSLLGGETRMGSALGPVLGGLAADALGLRTAFFLLAGFSLLVTVFSIAFLPADAGNTAANRSGGHKPALQPESSMTVMMNLVREHRRILTTAGFVVLTLKLIREARKVVFPLWGDLIGMTSSGIGLLFGVTHLVEMALFYPAGSIMDHYGRKKTAIPCLILLSLGFLVLPVAQTPAAFVLVAVLTAIGNGLGAGINMTLSTDLAPADRAVEFLAFWRTITDIGGAASPALIGFAGAALGLAGAAPLIGVLGLSGALVMAFRVAETLRRT